MQPAKTLAYVLFRSATSLRYYSDVIKSPFTFSLKIFLTVWFILTSITAIIWIPKIYRATGGFVTTLVQQLPSLYPQELIITIKDGQLSTNAEEPYYYPLENFTDIIHELEGSVKGLTTDNPTYFFVIDTQASLEDFDLYHTYALITDSHLIYYNDSGNLEVLSFKEFDDITLDYAFIQNLTAKAAPYSRHLPTIVAVVALIGIFLGSLWLDLVYLLLLTLITWLVARILRSRLAYSQSYQINLHTYTWYKLLFTILGWLALEPQFPFMRTLILGLLHLAIIIKLKEALIQTSSQPNPAMVADK